jgi:hypothetical protein
MIPIEKYTMIAEKDILAHAAAKMDLADKMDLAEAVSRLHDCCRVELPPKFVGSCPNCGQTKQTPPKEPAKIRKRLVLEGGGVREELRCVACGNVLYIAAKGWYPNVLR